MVLTGIEPAQGVRPSIANDQNTGERKSQAIACVEGIHEAADSVEIVDPSIVLPDGDSQVEDVVHHAGLKEVFQELIVHDSTASFDLDDKSFRLMVGIRVEGFFEAAVEPEEDRNGNSLVVGI